MADQSCATLFRRKQRGPGQADGKLRNRLICDGVAMFIECAGRHYCSCAKTAGLDVNMQTALQKHYQYQSAANTWSRPEGAEAFTYSDGDATENRIYQIIRDAPDTSVLSVALKSAITDWPSLYHLSPLRANLLRPIAADLQGPVLEIGCGCGAISRFLGEQGLEVVALEGSVRRAMITAERCRDLANVQVLAEPFQNFQSDQKFKTITLIGVLEYARVFYPGTDGRDPVDLMLERVSELLAPDGVLIVAIENQLGLKYFAGFNEDHLGKPMVGLEGSYNNKSVVTFGKKELGQRLSTASLAEQEWWFPFPDYKLPITVISEMGLTTDVPVDIAGMIGEACRADQQAPGLTTFSLDLAWSAVARNGLAAELSNSFLVIAGKQKRAPKEAFAYHFGHTRLPQYAKVVEFRPEGDEYVAVRREISDIPVSSDPMAPQWKTTSEKLVRGEVWRDRLRLLLQRQGWSANDITLWAQVWWFTVAEAYKSDLDGVACDKNTLLPASAIDAIPRNLIVEDNVHLTFIDQEWTAAAPVEIGYLLYRGLAEALSGVDFCARPKDGVPTRIADMLIIMTKSLGIDLSIEDLVRYAKAEFLLQERVSGNVNRTTAQAVLGRVIPERVSYHETLQHQRSVIAHQSKQINQLLELARRATAQQKPAPQTPDSQNAELKRAQDDWSDFLLGKSKINQ